MRHTPAKCLQYPFLRNRLNAGLACLELNQNRAALRKEHALLIIYTLGPRVQNKGGPYITTIVYLRIVII